MAHRVRVDIVREKNGPVSVKTVLVRDPGPGEALFNGGPGATGRSYSGYPTILASIRERLLTLPETTVVRTGHGDNTTIGAERETLAALAQ
jgi:glyoxylase-like metal-dependent hydrolase (beta-lactamase superfamily II)